jgi:hypothetical protein
VVGVGEPVTASRALVRKFINRAGAFGAVAGFGFVRLLGAIIIVVILFFVVDRIVVGHVDS